jgi:DNA-binding beta-propeller fold protein YncE
MTRRTIHVLLLSAALLLSIGSVPKQPHTTAPLEAPYVFLQSWGNEIGVFHWPSGIAVSEERVYVCDTEADRIQIFDQHGRPLATFGGFGTKDGQFLSPSDIAVDASGNVYVADKYNNRIQKFTADGTFLTKWGSEGSGDGQFGWPDGIAVDAGGNVYVADTYNNRIQKFTADGTFLIKWGSWGKGNGQFRGPSGIAVDASGSVYVADTDNHRPRPLDLWWPIAGEDRRTSFSRYPGCATGRSSACDRERARDGLAAPDYVRPPRMAPACPDLPLSYVRQRHHPLLRLSRLADQVERCVVGRDHARRVSFLRRKPA